MISSRPSHMSAIMIPVETSLNGSNDPIGPANPNAGPTLPSVVAAAAMAFERTEVDARPRRVGEQRDRPDDEQPHVDEHERDDRPERALVDRRAVQTQRRDELGDARSGRAHAEASCR